ncbi:MAG: hypothetical protein M5U34_35385 [Chloroflexi bacterium]|nr:hypothetical protein [Chloroflexota bacterium]
MLFTNEGHSVCDTLLSAGDGIGDVVAVEVVVIFDSRVKVIVGRSSNVAVEI